MTQLKRMKIVLLVLFLVGLSACDEVKDGGDAGSEPTDNLQESLTGTEFVVIDAQENGVEKTLVEGTVISVSFREGDSTYLTAYAGCNTLSGEYQLVDGVLRTGEDFMTTDMGCDPMLHTQDQWLTDVFTSSPTVTFGENELVLEAMLEGGTTVRLVLQDEELAIPDSPLKGTVWTVDTVVDGMAASSSTQWEPPATITFNDDGSVDVFTGCNSGSGSYTVTGNVIAITQLGVTEMACDSDAIMALEQDVLAVLAKGLTFEIDRNRLELDGGDIGLGLVGSPAVP